MPSRKEINDEKADRIAEALSTPEGRINLVKNVFGRNLYPDMAGTIRDMAGIGHIWSTELYISSINLSMEEDAFNNYLLMLQDRNIDKIKESIPHYSIMWLEVE